MPLEFLPDPVLRRSHSPRDCPPYRADLYRHLYHREPRLSQRYHPAQYRRWSVPRYPHGRPNRHTRGPSLRHRRLPWPRTYPVFLARLHYLESPAHRR